MAEDLGRLTPDALRRPAAPPPCRSVHMHTTLGLRSVQTFAGASSWAHPPRWTEVAARFIEIAARSSLPPNGSDPDLPPSPLSEGSIDCSDWYSHALPRHTYLSARVLVERRHASRPRTHTVGSAGSIAAVGDNDDDFTCPPPSRRHVHRCLVATPDCVAIGRCAGGGGGARHDGTRESGI